MATSIFHIIGLAPRYDGRTGLPLNRQCWSTWPRPCETIDGQRIKQLIFVTTIQYLNCWFGHVWTMSLNMQKFVIVCPSNLKFRFEIIRVHSVTFRKTKRTSKIESHQEITMNQPINKRKKIKQKKMRLNFHHPLESAHTNVAKKRHVLFLAPSVHWS